MGLSEAFGRGVGFGQGCQEAPGGDPHPSLSPASYELIQYLNPWQARADNLNHTGKDTKAEQGHTAGRLEARRKPWDGITEEACSTAASLVTPGRKVKDLSQETDSVNIFLIIYWFLRDKIPPKSSLLFTLILSGC